MIREKKERGITLVALIITIIILVILAAVAIKSVYDTQIVDRGVEGTAQYAYEQEKERVYTMIYEALIASVDKETYRIDYSKMPENLVEILDEQGYSCTEKSSVENEYVIYDITNGGSQFELKLSTVDGSYNLELIGEKK